MQRGGEKMERRTGWEKEEKEGRKEAWKSVFIFLMAYRPCGVAGMPFYSCSVMNECMRMCLEIKRGLIDNTKKCVGVGLSSCVCVCQSVSTFVCVCFSLTLEMVRGMLKSFPPCSLKPQGAGPRRVAL